MTDSQPHSKLITNTLAILLNIGNDIPFRDLRRAVRAYLDSPGKLMRPRLTEAYVMSIDPPSVNRLEVAKAAAIVELLHVVSLLQDDVIDGHRERRGFATPVASVGPAISIIASDYLIAEAVRLASELGTRVVEYLADVAKRLSVGQAGDIVGGDKRLVALLKTAPLFEAATYLPTIVLGFNDLEGLAARLGRSIGVLYQLLDDSVDEGGVDPLDIREAVNDVESALSELESRGFDVSPIRRYLNALLSAAKPI